MIVPTDSFEFPPLLQRRGAGGEANESVLPLEDIREIAFEFEQTVVNILSYKLFHAAEAYNISSVVLA